MASSVSTPLVMPAYAKINLTLEVLGRRPDGYHVVASVMQSIELHDHIGLRPDETLTLHPDGGALGLADNLVLRAAELLQKAAGVRKGAEILLEKRVPIAAGLGGGSSDAAATLRGLCRLWGLSLSVQDLQPIAAQLGSDVPFFLRGGTALAEGRGERITPLPTLPTHWLILVTPLLDIPNKTTHLYSRLTPADYTKGEATHALARSTSGPLSEDALFNMFEPIAEREFPAVRRWKAKMLAAGAGSVHLAGSGPTLFAICPDEASAITLSHGLLSSDARVFVTRTVGPVPDDRSRRTDA